MDDNSIYRLTEEVDSIIPKTTENINDWLQNIEFHELKRLYNMCVKRPGERSDDEDYSICRYSIVLYCREFGLTELGINSEFVAKITGNFCLSIISEGLRRQGILEFDKPM